MNLCADESVDYPIIQALRESGHNVFAVIEHLQGCDDERVLKAANRRRAILLTQDKDFGELVFRLKRVSSGVILLRLAGVASARKIAMVSSAIDDHESRFHYAFTVITEKSIRIRKIISH